MPVPFPEMSELLKQDEGCMLVKLLLAGSATMEVY